MPLPKKRYTSDDYWNLPDGERAERINGQLYKLTDRRRFCSCHDSFRSACNRGNIWRFKLYNSLADLGKKRWH